MPRRFRRGRNKRKNCDEKVSSQSFRFCFYRFVYSFLGSLGAIIGSFIFFMPRINLPFATRTNPSATLYGKLAPALIESDRALLDKSIRSRNTAPFIILSFSTPSGKVELAKRAKELGYDAIHDTVHEMARDEARHGKAFKGLLDRYFGK